MSYTANFETAKIYLATGLKERAREYLVKVVDSVPEQERSTGNAVYLKALALLARLAIEDSDRDHSAGYIEQGLAIKPDHADLLFLKALLFWDIQRYDDMFLALMAFLGAVLADDAAKFDYEYIGEKVVAEAVYKLLPDAYMKAASSEQLAAAIAAAAAHTDNALIKTVHKVLQKAERHGKEQQVVSASGSAAG